MKAGSGTQLKIFLAVFVLGGLSLHDLSMSSFMAEEGVVLSLSLVSSSIFAPGPGVREDEASWTRYGTRQV